MITRHFWYDIPGRQPLPAPTGSSNMASLEVPQYLLSIDAPPELRALIFETFESRDSIGASQPPGGVPYVDRIEVESNGQFMTVKNIELITITWLAVNSFEELVAGILPLFTSLTVVFNTCKFVHCGWVCQDYDSKSSHTCTDVLSLSRWTWLRDTVTHIYLDMPGEVTQAFLASWTSNETGPRGPRIDPMLKYFGHFVKLKYLRFDIFAPPSLCRADAKCRFRKYESPKSDRFFNMLLNILVLLPARVHSVVKIWCLCGCVQDEREPGRSAARKTIHAV